MPTGLLAVPPLLPARFPAPLVDETLVNPADADEADPQPEEGCDSPKAAKAGHVEQEHLEDRKDQDSKRRIAEFVPFPKYADEHGDHREHDPDRRVGIALPFAERVEDEILALESLLHDQGDANEQEDIGRAASHGAKDAASTGPVMARMAAGAMKPRSSVLRTGQPRTMLPSKTGLNMIA